MAWMSFIENSIRSHFLDSWSPATSWLVNGTDLSMDATDNSLNSVTTDISGASSWIHVLGFTAATNNGFFKVSSAATNKVVFDTAYRSVTTEVAGDAVEALGVRCPIKFPNTPFKAPDPVTDSFVELRIEGLDSSLRGLTSGMTGGGMYRTPGFIALDIFLPTYQGLGLGATYLDLFGEIFRGTRLSDGTQFYAPSSDGEGFDGGDGWWIRRASCPFKVDQHYNSTNIQKEGNVLVIKQTGHSFTSAPAAAYISAADTWTPAQADSESTMAQAIVVGVSGDWLKIATSDIHELVHALGTTGTLYLSQDTAGLLTTTRPTTGLIQSLGQIMSARRILVNIGPWA